MPVISDVRRTLEYAHSHEQVRRFLPFAPAGIALGLFLMTSLDGSPVEPKIIWLGSAVVALSLGLLCVLIYRRVQPSVPGIVLSPQGVLFLDFSDKVIAWNEIREVGFASVSASRDLFATNVMRLVVSQRYYNTLTNGTWHDSVVAREGDPSEIYLSYYRPLPMGEFAEAVRLRWLAFSQHAKDRPAEVFLSAGEPAAGAMSGPSATVPARRGAGVVQRAQSFAAARALVALLRCSTRLQLLAIAASLACIVALVTNQMGAWSTPAQDRGRAKAAEWRAWQQKFDASRKATDEEQRRLQDMWDKKFKCMDAYWSLHERGAYKQDPDCMRETK